MNKEKSYAELEPTRELAYKIVDKVFYPNGTSTHEEYIRRINQAGEISRMIIKHNEEQK
jgi:hypothetical protein